LSPNLFFTNFISHYIIYIHTLFLNSIIHEEDIGLVYDKMMDYAFTEILPDKEMNVVATVSTLDTSYFCR